MSDSVQMNIGLQQNSPVSRPTAKPASEARPELDRKINTTKELELARQKGTKVSISDQYLIKSIEEANKKIQGHLTSLEFSIHDKTKEIMVKVKDRETGEIIRELPPEKVLDMIANMLELAGLLVDERR